MHYRYIVVCDKKHAKTSEGAREYVKEYLESNEDFLNEENGQADWFVIGGRWSAELTKLRLDSKKLKAFEDEFEKKFGFYTSKDISREKRYIQAKGLFKKYFKEYKDEPIYWRDTYRDLGYEDDAQIINNVIYEKLIKEIRKENDPAHYCDIDDNKRTKKDFIGNWCIIVDYHN